MAERRWLSKVLTNSTFAAVKFIPSQFSVFFSMWSHMFLVCDRGQKTSAADV